MNWPGRKLLFLASVILLAGCKTSRPEVSVIGLWPEEPRLIYVPLNGFGPGNYYHPPTVNSLQPSLLWEAFPRPLDRESGQLERFGAITDVSYDLRIWRCQSKPPPAMVYERKGLTNPAHHLEQPLEAQALYAWSIRARFRMGDKLRATEWSRIGSPLPRTGEESAHFGLPDEGCFKFRTPKLATIASIPELSNP